MKKCLPLLFKTFSFILCLLQGNVIQGQSLCDSLTTTFVATSPNCYGSANGAINVTSTGGAMPYSYSWSNGSSTEDLSGLMAGVYTVVVTDLNGCTDTIGVTIGQPPALTNTITVQNVVCSGGSTGMIFTTVDGGTEPYLYFWSSGYTSANLIYMPAGTYVITVVDYLGCSIVDSVNILEPAPLTISLYSPETIPGYNVSTYGGSDGSIDLSVNGGLAPYAYVWSNTAVTEDLSSLTAGAYSVIVTDSNLCTANASIVLDQPATVEMPSGFTPNSDGNNDLFIIRGIEGYEENLLTVFNRWGNIVYQKENYQNQWNGYNNNGEELADGTYFAILEIKNKDIVLKNYVEMKRR